MLFRSAVPGAIIEYTVGFQNTGQDGATNVVMTDAIPANTTFVPGSLFIITNATGAPIGSMSDTVANDQAELAASPNRVVFRLGQGATGTAGGTIPPAEAASMRFRVQVNAGTANGAQINNTANVVNNAQTLPNITQNGSASANLVASNVANLDRKSVV